jgi:hypothetical protein
MQFQVSPLLAKPTPPRDSQPRVSREVSLLQCAVTKKRARKPFAFRTYIFKGLKRPWNEHLQKNTGGCPLYPSLPSRELQ